MNVTMTMEEWEDLKARALPKEAWTQRKAAIRKAAEELAKMAFQARYFHDSNASEDPAFKGFIKVLNENLPI